LISLHIIDFNNYLIIILIMMSIVSNYIEGKYHIYEHGGNSGA